MVTRLEIGKHELAPALTSPLSMKNAFPGTSGQPKKLKTEANIPPGMSESPEIPLLFLLLYRRIRP